MFDTGIGGMSGPSAWSDSDKARHTPSFPLTSHKLPAYVWVHGVHKSGARANKKSFVSKFVEEVFFCVCVCVWVEVMKFFCFFKFEMSSRVCV